MVEYWHWNTLPYGAETHWGGVLPHSGEPGRDLPRARSSRRRARPRGRGVRRCAEPEHDVAVLWDSDSKFAMGHADTVPGAPGAMSSTLTATDASSPRSRAGVFDADRQSRILRPQQVLPSRGGDGPGLRTSSAEHPVLVVAGPARRGRRGPRPARRVRAGGRPPRAGTAHRRGRTWRRAPGTERQAGTARRPRRRLDRTSRRTSPHAVPV